VSSTRADRALSTEACDAHKPLLASAAILVVGVLALLLDVRLTDGASALIVPFLVTCAAAASLVARSVVC
jgi:hypothetical protein